MRFWDVGDKEEELRSEKAPVEICGRESESESERASERERASM